MSGGSLKSSTTIRAFFQAVAGRYDLANHLLSGGLDFLWRWRAARSIAATNATRILDLATGSGDLARAIRAELPSAQIFCADFCVPMLRIAQRKKIPCLLAADALHLPFREGTFEAVTVAFGLRNMESWRNALGEMRRVLTPGGTLLVLDFSLPSGLFGALYSFYLKNVLPLLAKWVTREKQAYDYLADSIGAFPQGTTMEQILRDAGFESARSNRLTGGVVSLYVAKKGA